jgi:hypothetical protein
MSIRTPRIAQPVSPLIRLGYELDAHGFTGREAAVRDLVRDARSRGIDGASVDVLADIAAPDVARLRAFAAVSAAFVNPTTPRHLAGAA